VSAKPERLYQFWIDYNVLKHLHNDMQMLSGIKEYIGPPLALRVS
jgi:hypothetical protein